MARVVLYAAYLLIVTVLTLEGVVRIWGYSESYITDPIYASFTKSDAIPYIHKPNLVNARARGLAVMNTDSLGLRAVNAGEVYGRKPLSEYRIAIAGDSVTFGEGVPRTEETFPHIVESRLNHSQSDFRVKVFNYAASAYSVKQMAATLEYRMEEVEPDLVILAMIPHDLDLSRTPGAVVDGYLVNETVLPFLPSDSLVRRLWRSIRVTYLFRDLYLYMEGQPADIYQRLQRGEVPDSYRFIRQFRDAACRKSLEYLIVLLPSWQEGTYWTPIIHALEQDKMSYVDVSFLRKELTWERYRASPFDRHPSPAVHQRIGELLSGHIQSHVLHSHTRAAERP